MIFLDGATGTVFQSLGLVAGEDPTDWNITRPADVAGVHAAYAAAGSQVVVTNTFGANRLKYHGQYALADLIEAAVSHAKRAGVRVALDIGPTGRLLKPAGDLDFDEAYEAFAEQVSLGAKAGADLILIETMGDLREVKAAVLAAKEHASLPIWVSVTLDEKGKLLTGSSVACVASLLEGLRVDAYGFNCGLGPDLLLPYVKELAALSTRPILVKPNAGLPKLVNGRTVFPVQPEEFARDMVALAEAGATILGGCCGTTPEHIRAAVARLAGKPDSVRPMPPKLTRISSGTEVVDLHSFQGEIIGERINPTGKKLLKEALKNGDVAYVMREAVKQTAAGARVLDVNCGVPGINEAETLDRVLAAVESVVMCPLQIDTSDPVALERGLRHVNGIPLVNSVNGKQESMDAVFPLVQKYGGKIVALCLDENGIPATVEVRLAIAKRILAEGRKYGFTLEDFVFDALVLAVSAEPNAAQVTLETVKALTDELKVNTVLGVSNVSFGLPNRPVLNRAMYSLAKKAGLSAAIANPSLMADEADPAACAVLLAQDPNCLKWIEKCAAEAGASTPQASAVPATTATVQSLIISGLKEDARALAKAALADGRAPMALVQEEIVPGLEVVGKGFEKGTLYLPQLLMSADAAGAVFEEIRAILAKNGKESSHLPPIILATVKGDIHDIGKNIVRALLENYGFRVIDLGRDVPPETIVDAARESGARVVGLSALMTTTAGAMSETIRQLKAAKLPVVTLVGGAVVTEDYAREIGADYYAKDAMASVRICEKVLKA